MTKYLSTTFHSIVPRSIGIPNRIRSLLLAKYNSTNVEQCRIGNEDRDDPKEDCDPKQTQQRLLKVAIVGVPNAGKSSLINSIVQRNVSTKRIDKQTDKLPDLMNIFSPYCWVFYPDMSIFL